MIKKFLCFALIGLLLNTSSAAVSAQNKTDNSAAKIKTAILKRGTGENKRVQVQMSNGTKLKGFVSQADDKSFTLTDTETKQTTVIAYIDVARVKNRASRGDKVAGIIIISAIATVGVIVGSFLLIRCRNEGGC